MSTHALRAALSAGTDQALLRACSQSLSEIEETPENARLVYAFAEKAIGVLGKYARQIGAEKALLLRLHLAARAYALALATNQLELAKTSGLAISNMVTEAATASPDTVQLLLSVAKGALSHLKRRLNQDSQCARAHEVQLVQLASEVALDAEAYEQVVDIRVAQICAMAKHTPLAVLKEWCQRLSSSVVHDWASHMSEDQRDRCFSALRSLRLLVDSLESYSRDKNKD